MKRRYCCIPLALVAVLLLLGGSPAALAQGCVDYAQDYPDPTALLAQLAGSGDTGGVVVSGGLASIATSNGVQIFSLADPDHPVLLGRTFTEAQKLVCTGSTLYALGYGSDLQVIDIADPAHPALSLVDLGAEINPGGLAVDGNVLYVVTYQFLGGQLFTYDISDPGAPQFLGQYYPPPCIGISLGGSHAYLACGKAESDGGFLEVVDVADPAHPARESILPLPDTPAGVAYADGHVYVTCYRAGIWTYDVSDPAAPTLLGAMAGLSMASAIVANGSTLTAWAADAATDTWGLRRIDVSDPLAPVIEGAPAPLDYVYDLVPAGDRVYAAAGRMGLRILDVSTPGSPVLTSWSYGLPGYAGPTVAAGDQAYVISYGGGGLQVFDLGDPAAPALAATLAIGGTGQGLWAGGSRVLWAGTGVDAGYAGMLAVVDAADPAHPALLGHVPLVDYPSAVAAAGDYAYAVGQSMAFTVVDLADPAAPAVAGQSAQPVWGRAVVVAGSYAFAGSSDLYVMDISDPAHPFPAATLTTGSTVEFLALAGDVLFASGPFSAVSVIDVSDPLAPEIVGTLDTPGIIRSLRYADPYLYVADTMAGLMVVNVAQPAVPHVVGVAALPSVVRDMAMADASVFVTAGEAGILVAPLACPPTAGVGDHSPASGPGVGLVSAWPNPFNPLTTVSYSLDHARHVRVTVHDVRGRLVRVLEDRQQEAGEHAVAWRGTDAAGRALPSGTYFVLVDSGEDARTCKVALVR